MPYQNFSDGLYLAKRPALTAKIVDHYGVIDVGNRLGYSLPPRSDSLPVVVEQTADGLKAGFVDGEWKVEERIVDETGAIARIQTAMSTPDYDLFGNNCEHFARFVASGKKESRQLKVFATIGAVGVVLWSLNNAAGVKPKQ